MRAKPLLLSGLLVTFILGLVASVVLGRLAAGPQARVSVGGTEVSVWIADDVMERVTGLQGYPPLGPEEGMLFVWGDADTRVFEMKSVSYPIEILFFDDRLHISAIEPLSPGESRRVSSPSPTSYVLEVSEGWSARNGVGLGDRLVIGDGLPD